ncbi:S24/S26 family peptidase [Clostridium tagluense]|uniref:S24/S26 family peptidase n=1 Tax=Clostridium tagluense TaxID=360422 RepID=UPI001CF4BF09|nr:S24/S26 family peptidase [Clostridium tagluense]MCB2300095.1 S24/S26 family peptidase [Clostridium tagluense]
MEVKKVLTSLEKLSPLLLTMLNEGITVTLPVTGNSMSPLWKHKRDSVVLIKCDKYNLKKGDIALYQRRTKQYVLHRIVALQMDSYTMCGDAQRQLEKNIPKERVIAVVKSFTRKGKEYSCNHLGYQIYSAVWMWVLPFRGKIFGLYGRLSGVFK